MNKRPRLLLGLLTLFVASVLLDLEPIREIPVTFELFGITLFTPRIDSIVASFLAVTIATVAARGRFLAPAITAVVLLWLVAIYMLYQIALPAGPANLWSIALSNVPALLTTMAAAAIGAVLGQWYYLREFRAHHNAT